MSTTLRNSSKSLKKPAGKAKIKAATAKKKNLASKAKSSAVSAQAKPQKVTTRKTADKAVQKSMASAEPVKKTQKRASAAKKTGTQKDISRKPSRTPQLKIQDAEKKAIPSRAKIERKIKFNRDNNLASNQDPMPEAIPEKKQIESRIPELKVPIKTEIALKGDEINLSAKNITHDEPNPEIPETAITIEKDLLEIEKSEASKPRINPFARMLKLVRRPEKAAEKNVNIPAPEPKESGEKIEIPVKESPVVEKAKYTEAVVDRVAVLLDAIAGTSIEMESKIRAESESGLEAVYDASNLLEDSMPQMAFQTETNITSEAAIEDNLENGLRFSLDNFFREDRITPPEVEEPGDESEPIAPVLAEVGDIFQNTDEKDLIAEIGSDPDESIELNSQTELTEYIPEPGLPKSEDPHEKLSDPEENNMEEVPSEEREPETIPNKVVLLKPAEKVRPQLEMPDFTDRRRRPKRPWTLDVEIALRDLMGDVPDPSRIDFDQMVMAWKRGYESYFATSLAESRFPYIWADVNDVDLGDGIKKTFLSFSGCDLKGQRKLLALIEGDPDSAEIWQVMLKRLERRDLGNPRMFIGSSNLPLWEVLPKVFPRAQAQFCWNDFSRMVSGIFPKDLQRNANIHVNKIRHAPDHQTSESHIDDLKAAFGAEYPRAVTEFLKCKKDLLRYYSYPSKHWNYIKTSGKISTYFPTETLMKTVCKFEKMRDVSLYLVFNYLLRTQRRWLRIKGTHTLKAVQSGRRYYDGRQRPPKKNKKSPITADKKNTGNVLQKIMLGINTGLGSLFGKPRQSNKKYKMQPEAVKAQAPHVAISGTASANNISDPKAELEDLLRDRMKAENIAKAEKLPAALRALEKIKTGRMPGNDAISGMEREILEELNSEK